MEKNHGWQERLFLPKVSIEMLTFLMFSPSKRFLHGEGWRKIPGTANSPLGMANSPFPSRSLAKVGESWRKLAKVGKSWQKASKDKHVGSRCFFLVCLFVLLMILLLISVFSLAFTLCFGASVCQVFVRHSCCSGFRPRNCSFLSRESMRRPNRNKKPSPVQMRSQVQELQKGGGAYRGSKESEERGTFEHGNFEFCYEPLADVSSYSDVALQAANC